MPSQEDYFWRKSEMLSFYVKLWTDRWTDKNTDRWTWVKQYAPDLSMHKNYKNRFFICYTKSIQNRLKNVLFKRQKCIKTFAVQFVFV